MCPTLDKWPCCMSIGRNKKGSRKIIEKLAKMNR
jgi:hypothetical protein